MSGKIIDLTPQQVVQRAKSCVLDRVKYHLKYPNGGSDPTKPKPYDKLIIDGAAFDVADCIGFAVWCTGISRHFTGTPTIPAFPDTPSIQGSYINCASIVEESQGFKRRTGQPDYPGGRFFKRLEKPYPGCLIVFKGKKHGHIGVVTSVPAEAPLPSKMSRAVITDDWLTKDSGNNLSPLRVIHCSPTNEKRLGNAIRETDGSVWRGTDAIFVELNKALLGRPIV